MCCWVYKPKGVEMIDREEMKSIVNTNPDGIGIAYTKNGQLNFAKGFMTFDEFEKFYDKLIKVINVKDEAMLFHARITTTKSVKPFQCHPFVVTNNVEDLYKLHGTTDMLFVHNGSMQNFYSFNKKLSDTQNFDLHILSKMKQLDNKFYKKEFYLNWISDLTQKAGDSYNRFCFMDSTGYASFVGDVIKKDNGLVYANENHKFDIRAYFNEFYDVAKVKAYRVRNIIPPKNTRFAIWKDGIVVDVLQNVEGFVYWVDSNGVLYLEESYGNNTIIVCTNQILVCVDENMKTSKLKLDNICTKVITVYHEKNLVD